MIPVFARRLIAALLCLLSPWSLAGGGEAGVSGYRIQEIGGRRSVRDDRDGIVGEFLPLENESVRAEDAVAIAGPGLLRWKRTIALVAGQAKRRVRLTMDFRAAHECRFALIPGISWNGNRDDPGNVYRGFELDGVPWSFAWHRTLIPGATYSEGERHSVGLFADAVDPRGLSSSLVPGAGATVHRLIFPEEEMPARVVVRDSGLGPGRAGVLELAPGETFEATAWLVLHPVERPRLGYRHLLDAAWRHFHEETAAQRTAEELRISGVAYIKALWDEGAGKFCGSMQGDGKGRWIHARWYQIGWAGRNGDAANALLEDFLATGDRESRRLGLACLDRWVGGGDAGGAGEGPAVSDDLIPAVLPYAGSWRVTYDNGAVAHLRFLPGGWIGEHPSWGKGILRREGDRLACDWSHGERERYRLTPDGALAVEHVFEGKTFIGAGRREGLYAHIAGDINNLAEGATELFEAERLARRCGAERPRYRQTALGICDEAVAGQQEDGRFSGYESGRGAIGASMIPPLLTAWEITGQEKYLRSARSANAYYMGLFYRDGFLWGGTLDTRSIDKETVYPLLEGNLRLHESTCDRTFLVQAEDLAWYHSAWQITQSIPNLPGTLMDAVRYETFGGTSVATVHMCADPLGLLAFGPFLRLARHTGNDTWRQRAVALWTNATFGISDGTWELMGQGPRPRGSQDETVNYTDWSYVIGIGLGLDRDDPRGSGSEWLTIWPSAIRLEILADPGLASFIRSIPVEPLRGPVKQGWMLRQP